MEFFLNKFICAYLPRNFLEMLHTKASITGGSKTANTFLEPPWRIHSGKC